MTTIIPSLSKHGFTSNPNIILQAIFGHGTASDHSQSTIFLGNIFSIQKVISDNAQNPNRLVIAMQEAFDKIYKRYFEKAEVIVSFIDTDNGLYQLNINVSVFVDGEWLVLGKKMLVNPTEATAKIMAEIA